MNEPRARSDWRHIRCFRPTSGLMDSNIGLHRALPQHYGASIARLGLPTPWVVDALGVVEQNGGSRIALTVGLAGRPLGLQRREEALHRRGGVNVVRPAHRVRDAGAEEQALKHCAGVLRAWSERSGSAQDFPRRQTATVSESMTRDEFRSAFMDQPMTRRENRSSATATCSQPAAVQMEMTSASDFCATCQRRNRGHIAFCRVRRSIRCSLRELPSSSRSCQARSAATGAARATAGLEALVGRDDERRIMGCPVADRPSGRCVEARPRGAQHRAQPNDRPDVSVLRDEIEYHDGSRVTHVSPEFSRWGSVTSSRPNLYVALCRELGELLLRAAISAALRIPR